MSAIRAPPGLRRGHKMIPCTKKDAPAGQHWTSRKNTRSIILRKLRFTLLLKPGQCLRPLQNYQRTENSSLTPEHQCTRWAKRIWAQPKLILRQWRSANIRGSTSVRSPILISSWRCNKSRIRLQFHNLESSAKTMNILMSGPVVKKPRLTTNGKEFCSKIWKFSTSWCSWIVVKLWYQLVFYIATARPIKCFFKSSNTEKWQAGTGRPARFNKITKQKQSGEQQASKERPFARPSGMVRGVHRKSRRHRNARARTRFSGLIFGTSYESGIKVKEAPILYLIPKRDRHCEVCLRTKITMASLQEANCRSSTSGTKIRWLVNSRSHSSQRGRWISKRSQICSRGTRSVISMDSVLSV